MLTPGDEINHRYTITSVVCRNRDSYIYFGRDKEGESVAIKATRLDRCQTLKNLGSILFEPIMMQAMAHPNVCGVRDAFVMDGVRYLVMERCGGRDLHACLKQRVFSETEARWVVQQLVRAVAHLHRHGVAHRDIKLQNVFVVDSQTLEVRLGDFEFATVVPTNPPDEATGWVRLRSRTPCGTRGYCAPEVVRCMRYDAAAADMYSVGVVLYALLYRRLPFGGGVPCGSQEPDYGGRAVSGGCRAVVRALLQHRPEVRARPVGLLRFPWFRKGLDPAWRAELCVGPRGLGWVDRLVAGLDVRFVEAWADAVDNAAARASEVVAGFGAAPPTSPGRSLRNSPGTGNTLCSSPCPDRLSTSVSEVSPVVGALYPRDLAPRSPPAQVPVPVGVSHGTSVSSVGPGSQCGSTHTFPSEVGFTASQWPLCREGLARADADALAEGGAVRPEAAAVLRDRLAVVALVFAVGPAPVTPPLALWASDPLPLLAARSVPLVLPSAPPVCPRRDSEVSLLCDGDDASGADSDDTEALESLACMRVPEGLDEIPPVVCSVGMLRRIEEHRNRIVRRGRGGVALAGPWAEWVCVRAGVAFSAVTGPVPVPGSPGAHSSVASSSMLGVESSSPPWLLPAPSTPGGGPGLGGATSGVRVRASPSPRHGFPPYTSNSSPTSPRPLESDATGSAPSSTAPDPSHHPHPNNRSSKSSSSHTA